jgi:hypothetical protein
MGGGEHCQRVRWGHHPLAAQINVAPCNRWTAINGVVSGDGAIAGFNAQVALLPNYGCGIHHAKHGRPLVQAEPSSVEPGAPLLVAPRPPVPHGNTLYEIGGEVRPDPVGAVCRPVRKDAGRDRRPVAPRRLYSRARAVLHRKRGGDCAGQGPANL